MYDKCLIEMEKTLNLYQYRKNIVYIGLSTIKDFRHPQWIVEHIPHKQRGQLYWLTVFWTSQPVYSLT
jgi:hypothetical protein